MYRPDRGPAGILTALAASAVLLIAAMPAADAAPTTETVQGRYVRIVSSADWDAAAAMGPGASVRWDLVVSAAAPEPGTLRLGLSATGDASITVDARLCPTTWQGDTCTEGERLLRSAWTVPRDGRTVALDEIPADAVAHLRLDVRLDAREDPAVTQLRVQAEGFGDRIQTGPTPALPATGGSVPVVAIAGGAALLVAAAVLLLVGRRRRGGEDS
ncbi:MAG: LPXTG cell wall anchor domain-containing protein [Actinobacteria bacterium]|nr:LPXTG cell wall anchor domain-containing protein [Actinomycetota bacterium]